MTSSIHGAYSAYRYRSISWYHSSVCGLVTLA